MSNPFVPSDGLAWHYTATPVLPKITETMRLRPIVSPQHRSTPGELPLIWFSTHPAGWEPTLRKMGRGPTGELVELIGDEYRGGGVRFGYPVARLIPYNLLPVVAGMSLATNERITAKAKRYAAEVGDPSIGTHHWYCSTRSLSLIELHAEIDFGHGWERYLSNAPVGATSLKLRLPELCV